MATQRVSADKNGLPSTTQHNVTGDFTFWPCREISRSMYIDLVSCVYALSIKAYVVFPKCADSNIDYALRKIWWNSHAFQSKKRKPHHCHEGSTASLC